MNRKFIKSLMFIVAIILMVLPILSIVYLSYYNILTSLAERFTLYKLLNTWLVPLQTQLVNFMVKPYVRGILIQDQGFLINGSPIHITWNCLGWQSMLFFLASLVIGLQGGSYTLLSKIQTFILGVISIFWVNIFRMSVTVVLFAHNLSLFKILFHDYLAAMTTVVWLFVFWMFSYKFILEER